jgi:hypothetical protein
VLLMCLYWWVLPLGCGLSFFAGWVWEMWRVGKHLRAIEIMVEQLGTQADVAQKLQAGTITAAEAAEILGGGKH